MPKLLSKITSITEYLLLPYDGNRTELVDGQIEEMAEASPFHADIIDFLLLLLKGHVVEAGFSYIVRAGAIGIEIPRSDRNNNVRDSDLIVCDRAQWKRMRHLTKVVFGAGSPPALAVEVASLGNTKRDTEDKRLEYALAQVPEYWIVNPVDDRVLTMMLVDGEYQEIGESRENNFVRSNLFPTLSVTAASLIDPEA